MPPETPTQKQPAKLGDGPAAPEFKVIRPQKDEAVYQLAVADPRTVQPGRKVARRLEDDLPEGCNHKEFEYIWVNANPQLITATTRQLIDDAQGSPVTVDNHPQLAARLFSGDRIVRGDAMLWYFQKENAQEHYGEKRKFAADLMRRAQGHDANGVNQGVLEGDGMKFGKIE